MILKKKLWVVAKIARDTSQLISVLSSRKSSETVKQYVEQRFIDEFFSLEEQFYYLNRRAKMPYHAEYVGYGRIPYSGRISCGEPRSMEIFAVSCYAIEDNGSTLVCHYKIPIKASFIDGIIEKRELTLELDVVVDREGTGLFR